jgi:hypothetical protein
LAKPSNNTGDTTDHPARPTSNPAETCRVVQPDDDSIATTKFVRFHVPRKAPNANATVIANVTGGVVPSKLIVCCIQINTKVPHSRP